MGSRQHAHDTATHRGSDRRSDDGPKPSLYNVYRGEVAAVKNYGAFIKIPGFFKQGLVHVSQISKSRVEDAADVLSKGDTVYCKVISMESDGEKIGLSMKVVNQDSGEDLDSNNVNLSLDERKKKGDFKHRDRPKIELGAVLNTVCRKCNGKGHLAQDCFSASGKAYDLVDDKFGTEPLAKKSEDDKSPKKKKSKKDKKHKKHKKHKHSKNEEEEHSNESSHNKKRNHDSSDSDSNDSRQGRHVHEHSERKRSKQTDEDDSVIRSHKNTYEGQHSSKRDSTDFNSDRRNYQKRNERRISRHESNDSDSDTSPRKKRHTSSDQPKRHRDSSVSGVVIESRHTKDKVHSHGDHHGNRHDPADRFYHSHADRHKHKNNGSDSDSEDNYTKKRRLSHNDGNGSRHDDAEHRRAGSPSYSVAKEKHRKERKYKKQKKRSDSESNTE